MYYDRIKEARKKKGLTQKQLAANAEISVGSMSAYEKGTQVPPVDAAYRIAAALGVSLDWLFNEGKSTTEDLTSARSFGDVARAFLVMVDAGLLQRSRQEYVDYRDTIMQTTEEFRDYYKIIEDTNARDVNFLRITTDLEEGNKLIPFVEGVYKLTELVMHRTIDKEIYRTWVVKALEDLDKIPLNKGWFCNVVTPPPILVTSESQ